MATRPSPRAKRLLGALTVAAMIVGATASPALADGTSTTTSTPSTTSTSSTTTTAPTTTTLAPTTTTTTTAPSSSPPTTAPGSGGAENIELDSLNSGLIVDVEAEVGSAEDTVQVAQAQDQQAEQADDTVTGQLAQDIQRLAQLNQGEQEAATAVEQAQAHLRQLAVAAYESGGPGGPVNALLSAQSIGDYARRQGYFAIVSRNTADALDSFQRARAASDHNTLTGVDAIQRDKAAKAADDQILLADNQTLQSADEVLADREALLTLTSDAVSTPNTDIPRMVLDAYQRAAASVQGHGCQLQWWGLAGIGRVESDQGRAEHAELTPNGDLLPPIIGVPLTGQNGTALILDDSGAYAHAIGPLQFLPSTWAEWGADGNGDGVKDPNNIYDASLAAAHYLCATSTQLSSDPGLTAAYFSYNHSDDYVTEVLAYAHSYEEAQDQGLIPAMSPIPLYEVAPAAAQTLADGGPAPVPAAPATPTDNGTVPSTSPLGPPSLGST
jgi:membrane-bound lytic murein transglycosylase B